MSFLENLTKSKGKLKHTATKVTEPDGTSYLEKDFGEKEYLEPSCGFVIDTKPDRTPARVLDKLYVGSQDCVDISVLKEYNIKAILSVGISLPNISDNLDSNILTKYIPCLDLPETNLLHIIKESNEIIKNIINEDIGNVLVHCNAGVSRSVSVVIGFLILEMDMNFEDAYKLVKSVRHCAQPNSGFLQQLQSLK